MDSGVGSRERTPLSPTIQLIMEVTPTISHMPNTMLQDMVIVVMDTGKGAGRDMVLVLGSDSDLDTVRVITVHLLLDTVRVITVHLLLDTFKVITVHQRLDTEDITLVLTRATVRLAMEIIMAKAQTRGKKVST